MTEQNVDILIVGGGLVGAALALALRHLPLQVGLIEAKPTTELLKSDYDVRAIALTHASQKILQSLDLWQGLKEHSVALQQVHVSYQGHFGASRFNAKDNHVDALGYVVEAPWLYHVLNETLNTTQAIQFCPAQIQALQAVEDGWKATVKQDEKLVTVITKLLIAADGANSSLRQMLAIPATTKDYGQSALMTNISVSRPQPHVAYERFLKNGALAILPIGGDRYKLVITAAKDLIAELMGKTAEDFLQTMQTKFGYRLGKFLQSGKRWVYPLQQVYAEKQTATNVIVMGNAAHTLHPIAAQGFNLSLQDIATFADLVTNAFANQESWHSARVLKLYAELTQEQQRITRGLTEGLVYAFNTDWFPLSLLRSLGLVMIDTLPFIKKPLSQQLMGLGGKVSRMARGIRLK